MRTYSLFIEDDRYSVPTLVMIEAQRNAEAEEIALRHLQGSPHHLSIALWLDDAVIFQCRRIVGAPGDRQDETSN